MKSFAQENKSCTERQDDQAFSKVPEREGQQGSGRRLEYADCIGAKCDLTAKIRGRNSAVAKDSEAPD